MFRRPDRIIVPQYEPTPGLSLLAAAELLGESRRAVAAQVVDFAVRRIVRIARPAGSGRRTGFTLVLADAGLAAPADRAAGQDEREVLDVLFGERAGTGARADIRPRRNRDLGARLREPHRRAVARLIAGGFVRERGWFERLVVWWRKQPTEPTAAAAPLVDHLWGIHDYIRLAEAERFAMLQSPEGALRDAPVDGLEVLRLHERLLPYAVLFGLEKEWMAELDLRYRSLPPDTLAALESVGDVLEVVAVTAQAVELIVDIAQLADAVGSVDALDGVGAFLGGLGDALANIELPDFDLPDF